MLSPKDIKQEHNKVVSKMEELVRAALERGQDYVEGREYELHSRLEIIKDVLEWVNPDLVATDANGRGRIEQLIGDSRYYAGPLGCEINRFFCAFGAEKDRPGT